MAEQVSNEGKGAHHRVTATRHARRRPSTDSDGEFHGNGTHMHSYALCCRARARTCSRAGGARSTRTTRRCRSHRRLARPRRPSIWVSPPPSSRQPRASSMPPQRVRRGGEGQRGGELSLGGWMALSYSARVRPVGILRMRRGAPLCVLRRWVRGGRRERHKTYLRIRRPCVARGKRAGVDTVLWSVRSPQPPLRGVSRVITPFAAIAHDMSESSTTRFRRKSDHSPIALLRAAPSLSLLPPPRTPRQAVRAAEQRGPRAAQRTHRRLRRARRCRPPQQGQPCAHPQECVPSCLVYAA